MSDKDRIAIVHDSFTQSADADQTVEEIARMLPQADLLSAVRVEGKLSHYIRPRSPKTSWMSYLPAGQRLSGTYTLLHPFAIRGLDLSSYSMVISSCLGFARRAACPDDAIHLCYCHAPTRALWRDSTTTQTRRTSVGTQLVLKPLLAGLRKIDAASSLQPDYYVAKSQMVADDIWRSYGRKSLVIHPPVDLSRYHPRWPVKGYYVIVSSLLPHKRIDMVIAACNSTGSELLIVGEGPDRQRLENLAGPTVVFLGRHTEDETAELVARCQAVFCFDVEEDFDTMPLKANASGRPAISFAAGSALETIADGESGVLYREYSRPAIVDAMRRCVSLNWDASALRMYSREFDVSAFRNKFASLLDDVLGTRAISRAIA